MVEDRLVGIKSREVYEAPGAIALITAHQELENVTVERDLARFKRDGRPALGRAGLRRPVVLAAQAGARRASSTRRNAARHRRRPDDPARRPRRRHRPAQRGSRCTTSTWRPTTPATPSTSRWPRASSSSGACRARWPPQRDQRLSRMARDRTRVAPTAPTPTRLWGGRFARRARRGAGRAVGRASTSTGGWRRTTCAASRAHARVLHRAGLLDDDELGAHARRARRPRRRRCATARSGRPSRTRTCTPRSSAACSSGSARSAASCAPAAAATTRSPPTCGCTCATTPALVVARVAELRDGAGRPGRAAPRTRRCPGMTHLQHAQPVLFAHQLLAHVHAFARDVERLRDWDKRAALSPARRRRARRLVAAARPGRGGRASSASTAPCDNSIDAVSDRDFAAEFLFVAAMIGVHLSRLGEEVVPLGDHASSAGSSSTTPTRPGRRSCRRRRTPTSPSWPAASPAG